MSEPTTPERLCRCHNREGLEPGQHENDCPLAATPERQDLREQARTVLAITAKDVPAERRVAVAAHLDGWLTQWLSTVTISDAETGAAYQLAVEAVLVEPPGDLLAQMAGALREHHTDDDHVNWEGDAVYCVCGEMIDDWEEHWAEVALSVRWEDAAHTNVENAELRAKLRHAEAELSNRDHRRERWAHERSLREEAEAQVAALQNERDLLRETLGESDLGEQVLAQWEAIAAADADRDRLEEQVAALQRELAEAKTERDNLRARLTGVAIHAHRLKAHTVGGTSARAVLVDLLAAMGALHAPPRPDDPEEIRRLAQATTESTEEER